MKLIKIFSLLAIAGLLGACAYNPIDANLAPKAEYTTSNIGAGKSVNLMVVDERADKVIGHRSAGTYGKGAKITTSQDIPTLYKNAIAEGLSQNGFELTETGKDLKIEVRALSYDTSTGFWSGGVHTKSAVKAITGSGYEKMYRYENERRIQITPGANADVASINAAIEGVLKDLFADTMLLEDLAK